MSQLGMQYREQSKIVENVIDSIEVIQKKMYIAHYSDHFTMIESNAVPTKRKLLEQGNSQLGVTGIMLVEIKDTSSNRSITHIQCILKECRWFQLNHNRNIFLVWKRLFAVWLRNARTRQNMGLHPSCLQLSVKSTVSMKTQTCACACVCVCVSPHYDKTHTQNKWTVSENMVLVKVFLQAQYSRPQRSHNWHWWEAFGKNVKSIPNATAVDVDSGIDMKFDTCWALTQRQSECRWRLSNTTSKRERRRKRESGENNARNLSFAVLEFIVGLAVKRCEQCVYWFISEKRTLKFSEIESWCHNFWKRKWLRLTAQHGRLHDKTRLVTSLRHPCDTEQEDCYQWITKR